MKETEKRKETSNKTDDSKKKKQKWFIIIICFVLIAGVAEFGYLVIFIIISILENQIDVFMLIISYFCTFCTLYPTGCT